MKNITSFLKDRVRLFILTATFIIVVGGMYVHAKNDAQSLSFPLGDALEGTLELSKPTIKVTEDIYNKNKFHTVDLTIKLKSNIDQRLTGVKLILANSGLNYLESPTAVRFTHLLPRQNDIIFFLKDIPGREKSQAEVSIYAKERGVYVIKTDVETDQKVRATSNTINSVTLTVE